MKFSEFDLEPQISKCIEQLGFQDCTPIQGAVIPHILAGKDVSGLAQTGTGKTAAYLIPLIDRMLKGQRKDLPEDQESRAFKDWHVNNFILILVPTRELAEQVQSNVQNFKETGVTSVSIYGGTSYEKQKEGLKNHVDIIAATPGRLLDLYKENLLDLKQVRAVVFDEADRMFDMGFRDDMKYILSRIPRERQFLVFSATLNFEVLNTAYQFGAEPVEIDVSRDQAKAENVKDEIFHVGGNEKYSYLMSIIKKYQPKQTIIFTNFKNNVDRIANFLTENGIPAVGISSLLNQNQRNRVLDLFKAENDHNILVATDVAARGLDIQGVDMVINYELPGDVESYVHRIGRTGRAGNQGKAFSLVSDVDVEPLTRIENYLKNKIEIGWMDDADIVKDFKFTRHHDEDRGFKKPFQKSGGGSGGGRPPRGNSDRPPRDREPRRERAPHAGAAKPHAPAAAHANGAHKKTAAAAAGGGAHAHAKPHTSPAHKSHTQDRHKNNAKPQESSAHVKTSAAAPKKYKQYPQPRPQHKNKSGSAPAKTGVMKKISKFLSGLIK